MGVADERDVVAAHERPVQRGADARIGLGAGDDDSPRAAFGQDRLELGGLEGVAVVLVHHRLAGTWLELGDDLPPLGARRRTVVVGEGVLHPHDRHVGGPGSLHELGDPADHGITLVGVLDDVVLHVDDEEGGA
ncbi:hypothetical protein ASF38_03720 [Aeromicrobium sp. Leaf272]|nr:hypothetical protein ASF38_03720 [Aeromicrobium sp. Leaf272]